MTHIAEGLAQIALMVALGYCAVRVLGYFAGLGYFLLSLAVYFHIWLFWPETWRRMHEDD